MTLNTVNVPPRRRVESHTVYAAISEVDRSDRLMIIADTEVHAKVELLDKLGYAVVANGQQFILVDVETNEPQAELKSSTLEECLDEVLKAARWKVYESMDMIGSVSSADFSEVDDD